MIDVTIVPTIAGAAPNSPFTGSQVLEVRKPKPNCRSAGHPARADLERRSGAAARGRRARRRGSSRGRSGPRRRSPGSRGGGGWGSSRTKGRCARPPQGSSSCNGQVTSRRAVQAWRPVTRSRRIHGSDRDPRRGDSGSGRRSAVGRPAAFPLPAPTNDLFPIDAVPARRARRDGRVRTAVRAAHHARAAHAAAGRRAARERLRTAVRQLQLPAPHHAGAAGEPDRQRVHARPRLPHGARARWAIG